MRFRRQRRTHTKIALFAIIFVIGVILLHRTWPDLFGVFLAIAGTIGGLLVLYEVRLTKRIAEAEFVRDLQTSFTSDDKITELWAKLLLGKEIDEGDRHLVSAYLTFFETLHLLHSKGHIDLSLTDDLFRNRFFTAVGDKGIQDTALFRDRHGFQNIHRLVEEWNSHLLHEGKPCHVGYFSYRQALARHERHSDPSPVTFCRLRNQDLPALLALQEEVLSSLKKKSWLRENTADTFRDCLEPQPGTDGEVPQHVAMGAFKDDQLIAAGILFDAGTSDESIKGYLTPVPQLNKRAVNLKLVLTSPKERKKGLAGELLTRLEAMAMNMDRDEILCTIHPRNKPSMRLFTTHGYRRVGRAQTKYGKRQIYARQIMY